MNPLFLIDFYKVGHVSQYPAGTEQVFSTWTPRSSRVPGTNKVIHFGLQYFLKKYILDEFTYGFFNRLWRDVEKEYVELIGATLGVDKPKTDHLKALHDLRYMPLKFYSLPEGTGVPLNVPSMVVTNTRPDMFWLVNYIETLMSNILWMPSTSATTARRFRRIFEKYAKLAGETELSFIDWQGHDFSFRGMAGVESAVLSGMGHLTSFSGTDTIPAIVGANKYYGADLGVGGSVPATEHSVMCAGGQAGEFETFKRLITETYPTGIVSIVSDTWDLWQVLQDFIPRLSTQIINRNGKVVIRPDSGDPVNIVCGDPEKAIGTPQRAGALKLLANTLPVTKRDPGLLPLILNAGVIYGDGISPERAEAILRRTVGELGMSPFNVVFGIGSYTYQYVTRDTYNFAMKATAVKNKGKLIPIFKNPVTDNSNKKSHYGITAVYEDYFLPGVYRVVQDAKEAELDCCAFQKVFEDGKLLIETPFSEIRRRVREF